MSNRTALIITGLAADRQRMTRVCARKGCSNVVLLAATGRPRRYCSDACKKSAYRQRVKRRGTRTDEWTTPPDLFTALDKRYGPFTLDVAATAENAVCPTYFTREVDGLAQEWTGRVWCNPPYGRALGEWMRKAWEASESTAEVVVCLVPARTDTQWWGYAELGEIHFVEGRLRFGEAGNVAPFPSAIVEFRARP
jgi:phage N-6-adenine-methyltransferase